MAHKTLTVAGDSVYTEHFRASPAQFVDVPRIAANLRNGDRLELERFYDDPPEKVMRDSLEQSAVAWTAFNLDDVPVAMWGAAAHPLDERLGIPWLLGTDGIAESSSDFLRLSRYFDRVMGGCFRGLANLVDAEYAEALRWLDWLGYNRGRTIKFQKGYDFIVMHKETNSVRQHRV